MAKTWSITGPAKTPVKDSKPAEITFSITNILAEPVSGLVRILPQPPLTASSFKPPQDSNLSFAANETKSYTFSFDPTGLLPGTFMYEVTVAPPANPNDPMADRITSSAEVETKPPTKWWIYAIVAAVLVLGGVAAFLVLGGKKVPDVVDQNFIQATKALEGEGLTWEIKAVEDDTRNGTVLSTNPEPGSKAGDEAVVLSVSTGPAIPPVVQKQVADVKSALEDLGFEIKEVPTANAAAAGEVISSDPAEGERADPGEPITLLVSTGPGETSFVEVPSVFGQTLAEATQTLQDKHLGEPFSECHDVDPWDGRVYEQFPSAGAPEPPGTRITVRIASHICFIKPWLYDDVAVALGDAIATGS